MGVVTVFVKENCPYCERVKVLLARMHERLLQDFASEGRVANLTIQEISARGSYAVLCLRLTGTVTVPHVFFNSEYVGDSDMFCFLGERPDEAVAALPSPGSQAHKKQLAEASHHTKGKPGCNQPTLNIIYDKLCALAESEDPSPRFPPQPDAVILKVTDETACSSQPSLAQLRSVGRVGVASVLNLSRHDSPMYVAEESELVLESGAAYVECPVFDVNEASVREAIEAISKAPRPVLVHDGPGEIALLMLLLAYGVHMQGRPSVSDVLGWGTDLGSDLSGYARTIEKVLAAQPTAP